MQTRSWRAFVRPISCRVSRPRTDRLRGRAEAMQKIGEQKARSSAGERHGSKTRARRGYPCPVVSARRKAFPGSVGECGGGLCVAAQRARSDRRTTGAPLCRCCERPRPPAWRRFRQQTPVSTGGRSRKPTSRNVEREDHRQFPLLAEALHEGPPHPVGHVPIDVPHLVAGHVLAQFLKIHSPAFEMTQVSADHHVIHQPVRAHLDAADGLDQFVKRHGISSHRWRLELGGLPQFSGACRWVVFAAPPIFAARPWTGG